MSQSWGRGGWSLASDSSSLTLPALTSTSETCSSGGKKKSSRAGPEYNSSQRVAAGRGLRSCRAAALPPLAGEPDSSLTQSRGTRAGPARRPPCALLGLGASLLPATPRGPEHPRGRYSEPHTPGGGRARPPSPPPSPAGPGRGGAARGRGAGPGDARLGPGRAGTRVHSRCSLRRRQAARLLGAGPFSPESGPGSREPVTARTRTTSASSFPAGPSVSGRDEEPGLSLPAPLRPPPPP